MVTEEDLTKIEDLNRNIVNPVMGIFEDLEYLQTIEAVPIGKRIQFFAYANNCPRNRWWCEEDKFSVFKEESQFQNAQAKFPPGELYWQADSRPKQNVPFSPYVIDFETSDKGYLTVRVFEYLRSFRDELRHREELRFEVDASGTIAKFGVAADGTDAGPNIKLDIIRQFDSINPDLQFIDISKPPRNKLKSESTYIQIERGIEFFSRLLNESILYF